MKKLRYTEEDSAFIFRYFIYFGIATLIVLIVTAPISLANTTVVKMIAGILGVAFILTILASIVFAIMYLVNRKANKKYKEIKQNGTKVEGEIIGWGCDVSGGLEVSITYWLYISYLDLSGNQRVFRTPSVNFNPKITLGSTKCSVYLYENNIYATDFIKSSKTTIRVFKDVNPSSDDLIK